VIETSKISHNCGGSLEINPTMFTGHARVIDPDLHTIGPATEQNSGIRQVEPFTCSTTIVLHQNRGIVAGLAASQRLSGRGHYGFVIILPVL
jgi:hypothetical protein